jgi:hypothetical protein
LKSFIDRCDDGLEVVQNSVLKGVPEVPLFLCRQWHIICCWREARRRDGGGGSLRELKALVGMVSMKLASIAEKECLSSKSCHSPPALPVSGSPQWTMIYPINDSTYAIVCSTRKAFSTEEARRQEETHK